ncbi:HEPN-associated N-terminal domain-containing protein [Belliella sp. DSM 111904]|uniref:HEPN-associated N-terminal domain-containing protein n=1 Tax=Belliella filtrata TaxID=2923435 RepID=A0ABS9V408_9BACT|nr:HEPN-associated N-terminal domain-containing protein [Belliella filtrata]MCH7411141.1 HEPN-associated N-terminal domain-containing protein [Belliella filtrata]
MGAVKQHMIEMEELHICGSIDKKICNRHFNYQEINDFIKKNKIRGTCDYCNKRSFVEEFDEVMKYIMTSISKFYTDAVNFSPYNSREGGYLANNYNVNELIEKIDLDSDVYEVIEDVIHCIDDIPWSSTDEYYGSERDEVFYLWEHFKHNIKHSSRFLFNINDTNDNRYSYKTLEIIGDLIQKFKLITIIPSGSIVFRCRQNKPNEKVTEFKDLISTPHDISKTSNRFSPAGISMFYCSFDNDISIREIYDKKNKKGLNITTGVFKLKNDTCVIDFTKLPAIPNIFGAISSKEFFNITLLHDLVRDFTLPIEHDGREHRDYVPTQVVTEYLKYTFNKKRNPKVEGIIYPSSKDKTKKSMVFFWNNSECRDKVEMIEKPILKRISNLKKTIVELTYETIVLSKYNKELNNPHVYKFEIYGGENKLEFLSNHYVMVEKNRDLLYLSKIIKSLEAKAEKCFVTNNGSKKILDLTSLAYVL